jgi:GrpB-like predicted nucleotidyltransferase (UPF0157 family)
MIDVLEITPYDVRWAEEFENERARLQAALATLAVRIDHHGSTSVPGLAAKPVIDIQLSVQCLHPLDSYAGCLAKLGYVHVPHADDAFAPFFHRPEAWPHTHHIHVVASGSEEERRTACVSRLPARARERRSRVRDAEEGVGSALFVLAVRYSSGVRGCEGRFHREDDASSACGGLPTRPVSHIAQHAAPAAGGEPTPWLAVARPYPSPACPKVPCRRELKRRTERPEDACPPSYAEASD